MSSHYCCFHSSQLADFIPSGNNFCISRYYCCSHFLSAGLFQSFQQQFLHVRPLLLLPLLSSSLFSDLPATILTCPAIFVASTSSKLADFISSGNNFCISRYYCCFHFFSDFLLQISACKWEGIQLFSFLYFKCIEHFRISDIHLDEIMFILG